MNIDGNVSECAPILLHVVIFYDKSRNNFMYAILWIMENFQYIEDILHNTEENSKKGKFSVENLLKRHLSASERYFCLGLEVLHIIVRQ